MATIEGREKLLAKFRALPPEARSRIKQALAQGADEITTLQKQLVPRDTGKLADSIRQTWGNKPVLSSAGLAGGGAMAGDPDLTVWITAGGGAKDTGWYARFVEFGTASHVNKGAFPGTAHPGTKAQPFFFPAYWFLRRRVKSRIARAISKSAKDVASRG